MNEKIASLTTEQQNQNTLHIDRLSTFEMVSLINQEDGQVIQAVNEALPAISAAVDAIYETLRSGGRLVYIGAGTSGRLGVLDASECLPTFGVGEEAIIGLIAGGDQALRHPVEGVEDSEAAAVADLKRISFNEHDILCVIGASGRTPYCIGGLTYAKACGAKTISLACVSHSRFARMADYPIEADVGQEVIAGSTRMKSGSATKMILNMLSTGAMIKLGKVYGNLMVDVQLTNEKLVERARNMVMKTTHCSYERAVELLEQSENKVKYAIVMELCRVSLSEAKDLLHRHHDNISAVLELHQDN